MKVRKLFFSCLLLIAGTVVNGNAQVTIGSQSEPPAGALLNLENVSGVKKGLLLPYVELPSDLKQWGLSGESIDGMVVYNIASGLEGAYVRVNGVWKPLAVSVSGAESVFTDPDDGKSYAIKDYGTAGVWFIQNSEKEVVGSIPCENPGYGRLYTSSQAKLACPDGWHLPSDEEWNVLEQSINTTYNDNLAISPSIDSYLEYRGSYDVVMRIPAIWNRSASNARPDGTNTSGFGAVPSGYYLNGNGYKENGYSTIFMTSTPVDASNPDGNYYARAMHISQTGMARWLALSIGAYPVRCVKE